MATEKQIAANRANSKRSTGPKTGYGRAKSSRNAFRHGLSRPMAVDITEVDRIALGFAMDGDGEAHISAAGELAHAYLEMARIRAIRRQILASLFRSWQPAKLKRLVNLDRYQRSAFARGRRAAKRSLDEPFSLQYEKADGRQSAGLSRRMPIA